MKELEVVAYHNGEKLAMSNADAKESRRIKEVLEDPTPYEIRCVKNSIRGRVEVYIPLSEINFDERIKR